MSRKHLANYDWWRRSLRAAALVLAAFLAVPALVGLGQSVQSGQVPGQPPVPPRDPAKELALKINGPLTVASVGDVMIKRPASMLEDPAFQSAIKIIRDADIAIGNMEGNLADILNFDGPLRGMMGSKEVAPDLKAMGFDLMNRANNHIFDSDRESMESTIEQLDKAGIVHAGTGKNLETARAPAYLDTPKGRVGIVGMHTPNGDQNRQAASYEDGNTGGRPGLNAIRYTVYYNVTQEQLDALKKIRIAAYTPPPGATNTVKLPANEPADRVQLFDVSYKVGTPGTRSFEANKDDVAQNLRSIRNGKYLSNFMAATIHAHQGPITSQEWLYEDQTPDFLIDFAHKTIDNGADVFVGHGPHVLRGVEIYKGKPVFYGLGEFFYEWGHMDASIMTGSWGLRAPGDDRPDVSNNRRSDNFESMIALSRYDQGKLVEVRLYPTDLRYDGPLSTLGIPRSSPPEIAQRILTRVANLSKAFGTNVTIEGNVGVIRVTPSTAPTGQQQ